jgi:protein-S-isoprenylcysteine O-methyltransferase Ste14
MKITGAAPKIAIPTIIYMFIAIYVDKLKYPLFKISLDNYSTLVVIGVIMVIIGVSMVIAVQGKLRKSFYSGLLMQDGLYKVLRNPMYDAYLIFVFPGLSLLLNSWLVMTTFIVNFILLQIFIREEYRYLDNKFGVEYKSYLNNVWVKFL